MALHHFDDSSEHREDTKLAQTVRAPIGWGERILLAGLAIVLLLAIILYFTGLAHGRAQLAQTRSQLDTAQSMNRLLAARGWLYRASEDLDARNFGMANTDVSRAAQILASVPNNVPGVDMTQLNGARQRASSLQVTVADNIAAQRSQLLTLTNQLNTALPAQVAGVDLR